MWTFGRLCGKKHLVPFVPLPCEYPVVGTVFGVKCDLMLALGGQFFEHFRETFDGNALEYLEPARFENTYRKYYGFFLWKRLSIIGLFEGFRLVGTQFHPPSPAQGPCQNKTGYATVFRSSWG